MVSNRYIDIIQFYIYTEIICCMRTFYMNTYVWIQFLCTCKTKSNPTYFTQRASCCCYPFYKEQCCNTVKFPLHCLSVWFFSIILCWVNYLLNKDHEYHLIDGWFLMDSELVGSRDSPNNLLGFCFLGNMYYKAKIPKMENSLRSKWVTSVCLEILFEVFQRWLKMWKK